MRQLVVNENLRQQASLYFDEWISTISGEIVELSTIIDVRDGTHDSPKSVEYGYPLVTSKHLLPFDLDLETTNKISIQDYNKVNERSSVAQYDILMSMIGTVGLISYIHHAEINFAIKNVALFRTSLKPDYAIYLLMYLKSKKTSQHIEKCLAGSTQKYISLTELRRMPIVNPTKNDLASLNEVLEPLINAICNNINQSKRLSMIRDSLLPKLMSGELDVSEIDL